VTIIKMDTVGDPFYKCDICGRTADDRDGVEHRDGCDDAETATNGGTSHQQRLRLPAHLKTTPDGRVRCPDCGVTGLRPLGHADDCAHDHKPTREGESDA